MAPCRGLKMSQVSRPCGRSVLPSDSNGSDWPGSRGWMQAVSSKGCSKVIPLNQGFNLNHRLTILIILSGGQNKRQAFDLWIPFIGKPKSIVSALTIFCRSASSSSNRSSLLCHFSRMRPIMPWKSSSLPHTLVFWKQTWAKKKMIHDICKHALQQIHVHDMSYCLQAAGASITFIWHTSCHIIRAVPL